MYIIFSIYLFTIFFMFYEEKNKTIVTRQPGHPSKLLTGLFYIPVIWSAHTEKLDKYFLSIEHKNYKAEACQSRRHF